MPFTPVHTLLGGGLLHLSTSSLLADTGRVLGISGVLDGAFLGDRAAWRWATVVGLIGGPVIAWAWGLNSIYASDPASGWTSISLGRSVLAGLLVGLGSRLGSGCTSGHFLCGVSRGSKRSIIATATFFTSALVTANYIAPLAIQPITSTAKPLYTPTFPKHKETITLFLTFGVFRLIQYSLERFLSAQKAPSPRLRNAPYLLAGLTFSFGLLISGMADPSKVLSFLHPLPPFTAFDPSLAIVVLSGVIPNAVHWYSLQKGKPKFSWERWNVPTRNDIDWRLLVGSAIFGAGWGLAGVCPGPAIVSVGRVIAGRLEGERIDFASRSIAGFMGAMLLGMGVARGI